MYLLLLCRQAHPPLHNQLPLQEQTVTTVTTQSCEETNYAKNKKRNLLNPLSSFVLCYYTSQNLTAPRSAIPVKDCNLLLKCSCLK